MPQRNKKFVKKFNATANWHADVNVRARGGFDRFIRCDGATIDRMECLNVAYVRMSCLIIVIFYGLVWLPPVGTGPVFDRKLSIGGVVKVLFVWGGVARRSDLPHPLRT